ncbi:MAG: class I adenylate-forming enzyme family protein [Acidimicrobiales bacterium]
MSRPGHREASTAVDVLRASAEDCADAEAYVEYKGASRHSLTFGGLDAAADASAAAFADRGVTKGDVVALLLPSSIDYAVCYHAALRLGAVTSGVNPRLGENEKASIFGRLGAKVTVTETTGPGAAAGTGNVIDRAEVSAAVSEAAAGRGRRAPGLPRLDPSDPVAIVWTGGSTGIPKGALFDHDNLRAVAAGTDVLSAHGDRRLSPLPFAHVGYMTRAWDEISNAITTVITPTPWSAGTTIALIESEAVTVGQGVPTQWALVLAHPDVESADLSSLRVAGTGASRVPPGLVRAMRERLGCPVVVRYTSTETSLGTGTRPDDPDDIVATTVGRPVPGVELELVDDAGNAVPTGEVGKVRMRSAAGMRGYVGHGTAIDEAATRVAIDAGGWISTGDLGRMGDDGNLRLVGRSVEMVIRGGYNVYPAEVEAVLGRHPGVAQVTVVGAPDPVLGEIVVAFVVPAARAGNSPAQPTLEQLRAHCRASLADYKAPDRLEIVTEMPVTPLGKIDSRALSALAVARHETQGASA